MKPFSEFTEYDMVCFMEAVQTNKRFLPYSIGTPTGGVSFDDCYPRANIIFFSDSHVDFRNQAESLDNVRRTIEFSNESPVVFDAIVNSGDAITPFQIRPKQDAIDRFVPFFDELKKSRTPVIYAKGNHDLNDWGNYPENAFTDKDFGDMYYDFAESNFGIIRQTKKNGNKSTWHYYDIEAQKIRVVAVDILDVDKTVKNEEGTVKYYGGKFFYISNEQINWLCDTALRFDDKQEKDWGVILAFHMIPKDKPEYQNAATELFKICEAFNKGGKYENNYVCEYDDRFSWNVRADFTDYAALEKKPHIICCLIGHDHEDKHTVINGINLIWTLNGSATNLCGDARIARPLGTSLQNSFDILNIDTRKRRIRIFKYGAGLNCYGSGGDRFLPDGIEY